ncbi:hypothetical protein Pelo_12378 [Pelomyxa schiedti]|nr:hypothetical protein Pelo_12934 [Pelomyxa schiedti]KAH3746239.1 hypothetical protein Pelo_12378 [Pelomyxa schiedti]
MIVKGPAVASIGALSLALARAAIPPAPVFFSSWFESRARASLQSPTVVIRRSLSPLLLPGSAAAVERHYGSDSGGVLGHSYSGKAKNSGTHHSSLSSPLSLRVLEVGCAGGCFTLPLASFLGPNSEVVAVDVQKGMINRLSHNITKFQVAKKGRDSLANIKCLTADVRKLPFASHHFDAVVMVCVLPELRKDMKPALSECSRVVRNGGVIAVSDSIINPNFTPYMIIKKLAVSTRLEVLPRAGRWYNYTACMIKHDE